MRFNVVLAIAFLALFPESALARQIFLACETIVDGSGERTHRSVEIDPVTRTVRDNRMIWTNGKTSPLAANLAEFMTVTGVLAHWGNRVKESDTSVNVFTLDLRTGTYTFTGLVGRLGHGTSWRIPEAP